LPGPAGIRQCLLQGPTSEIVGVTAAIVVGMIGGILFVVAVIVFFMIAVTADIIIVELDRLDTNEIRPLEILLIGTFHGCPPESESSLPSREVADAVEALDALDGAGMLFVI
jgi:hypothetical protein